MNSRKLYKSLLKSYNKNIWGVRHMKRVMIVLMLLILVFAVGCGGESKKKLVASRPVVSDDSAYVTQETAPMKEAVYEEPVVESAPVESAPTPAPVSSPAGTGDCDKLSGSTVGAALGGNWIKADDCPKYPQLPGGVKVCQCSYQWTSNFVDIETQIYSEGSQERVFDMYCSSSTTEVGDKSCRWESPTGVQFVYFLHGNTFAKVACRGNMCDMDKVATLAKSVNNNI